jgi:ubiquinone/menaquinone biosynthesis C-methylase UbiE
MDRRRQYVISFTDLVYAALLGYALQQLDTVLTQQPVTAGIVSTAILYLIYDWYGEHSLEVNVALASRAIQFDFMALALYFGLIYCSTRASVFFMLFMAIRAGRGIIINLVLLHVGNPQYAPRLKSYNVSSGVMASLYTIIFALDILVLHLTALERLVTSFGLWALAYASALVSERRYRMRLQHVLSKSAEVSTSDHAGARSQDGEPDAVSGPQLSEQQPVPKRSAKQTAKFYDAVSQVFERDFYSDLADPCIAIDVQLIWGLIRQHVSEPEQLLEIGCGTGHWLSEISTVIGARVYGIDISIGMIHRAASRGHRRLAVAEASSLPFARNSFDVVISPYNALDHCEQYEAAFAEVRRVLRPGGVALLMLDNRQRLIRRYWDLRSDQVRSQKGDPRDSGSWVHIVDGTAVDVYTHMYTQHEVIAMLPDCTVEFIGVGNLTPLVPQVARRHLGFAIRWLAPAAIRLERWLGERFASRSAHLFVIATKKRAEG